MSTSWVAATVRARALARRRLGASGARALATSDSVQQAIATLASTPYGHDVQAGHDLARAQHGVAATLLWHLRVLGGWVPRTGTPALRSLAAGFEVANVDEHLRDLHGLPAGPTFALGSFATAWHRLALTRTPSELRDVLSTSVWGDPGAEGRREVGLYLRVAWLVRVAASVPLAREWTAGALALLLTREHYLGTHPLPAAVVQCAERLLGPTWNPTRVTEALSLPAAAAWAVADVTAPDDLWPVEAAWWRRVERDAFIVLRRSSSTLDPTVAALALLAVDAWRVRAALEAAAGRHADLELFDAVA